MSFGQFSTSTSGAVPSTTESLLGATTVTTDGNGDAAFTNIFATGLIANRFITATATDPFNNTSEFSACFPVTLPPDADNDGLKVNPDWVEDHDVWEQAKQAAGVKSKKKK